MIIELTGSKSELSYQPMPPDDPTRRVPDITKAMDKLRWKPELDLREGLRRVIDEEKKSL